MKIIQRHLCKVPEKIMQEDVEDVAKFAGTDLAVELRGKNLHLFSVRVIS